jgi:hypothetical protein
LDNKWPPIPNLLQGLLRGCIGGFAGALAGHILVTAAIKAGGQNWLKGPYGPHFFDISLYLAVLYAAVGWALALRPAAALVGLLGAFLGIALPMAVLTRLAHWGMDTGAPPTLAWYWAVVVAHSLGTWGTTLALGALLCPARRWLGALGAALGSLAGYGILQLFLFAVPSYAQGRWDPKSFLPSPLDLLTGILIGAGIGAGIFLAGKSSRQARHA